MIPAAIKAELAAAAQEVYNAWEQDEEGNDEEYGGGGICHDIADAMVGVLDRHGIEAHSVSQSIGDVHVYVIAKLADGVYSVDIPPGTYEIGSAYTWRKKKGVVFNQGDVDIDRIDADPEKIGDYVESNTEGFRGWLACVEANSPFMVRRTWPALVASEMEPPASPASRRSRRVRRR